MVEQHTPDWAINEARKRAMIGDNQCWSVEEVRLSKAGWSRMTMLAASLIAEHEQEPVDPLLIEARAIAAKQVCRGRTNHERHDEVITGEWDQTDAVMCAFNALKRGIEIGGGS